ncbi:MAG: hypothetical protein GX442_06300, partial [Candidatus Riflebacteria bacterium]|nr:hypothetical protein [Candidatus Riflebacteria bacterium]
MTRSFSIPNPLNPEDADRLFLQIKQALLQNIQVLNPIIRKRFGKIRSWKLFRSDVAFEDKGEVIDLVFELEKETPQRYLLIDLSVPCLGKGQKYSLDAKAAHFHEEFDIPLNRLKKAILLVKKGNESVPFGSSRLQVPILEISLRRLFGEAPADGDEEEGETRGGKKAAFAKDLLLSLKEAIVHESLATLQKRRNKYVRRGLWRWLEREILDPNVHFFLIILSSIYQGKTSEVLSRQFTTLEQYTRQPDQVIEKLFSNETGLAPEVAKAADRHRKALQKFLECFAATPPYEYLRSLFLKEFRSTRDSLAARVAVFDTLRELLARCGFTGEKEVQYPLEILDELGIFQGLLMGNYAELRVENATKKLQQLVPDRPWTPEEVYKLRDELAQLLHLPPAEFNLNAFLPQTFSQAEGQRGRSRTAGAESRNRSGENDFGGFEEGGVPAAQVPSRAAMARAATQARAGQARGNQGVMGPATAAAPSPTPSALPANPAAATSPAANGTVPIPADSPQAPGQGEANGTAGGNGPLPPAPLPQRPAPQPPRTTGQTPSAQPARPPHPGQGNQRAPQPGNQPR